MNKSRKLLSLLVTATGACAASHAPVRAPVASATEVQAVAAPGAPAVAPVVADMLVAMPAADPFPEPVTPLLQANGRPACGNIQTKGGVDAQRAMWLQERADLVARLHAPRPHAYAEHVRLAQLDVCLIENPGQNPS